MHSSPNHIPIFTQTTERKQSASMGVPPVEVLISPREQGREHREQLEAVPAVVPHARGAPHRVDHRWDERTGVEQVCSC